eukprot:3941237-Rhodomonas_salina.1
MLLHLRYAMSCYAATGKSRAAREEERRKKEGTSLPRNQLQYDTGLVQLYCKVICTHLALSGTGVAYAATTAYAMSGTYLAYAATRAMGSYRRKVTHGPRHPEPVSVKPEICPRSQYAVCGDFACTLKSRPRFCAVRADVLMSCP